MSTSTARPTATVPVSSAERPSRPQTGSIRRDESPSEPSPPRRAKDEPKGRNAKAEAASKKSGDREKQDPKKVGPWRIGKTIGTGSSGTFLPLFFPLFFCGPLFIFTLLFLLTWFISSPIPPLHACKLQDESRLRDMKILISMLLSRLYRNRVLPNRVLPQKQIRYVLTLSHRVV